jgi:hypothetical protein
MSDTPRTDALLSSLGAAGSTARFAEHARQLERELERWKQIATQMAQRDPEWLEGIARDEARRSTSAGQQTEAESK